ncbi:hypothetical protein HU751_016995 [Pseudomonas sp. BW13M1]|uniref:Lipoprotein n=1 Tax=Pseudomonas peradeniyensis TaxID=2745488 RepID=A0A923JXE4_9PSED|nr:hypothetical protein [Pseudomonas peradeniyensis]MBV4506545.1 hypothetical protein [Pseudomonas peradeniyensis]
MNHKESINKLLLCLPVAVMVSVVGCTPKISTESTSDSMVVTTYRDQYLIGESCRTVADPMVQDICRSSRNQSIRSLNIENLSDKEGRLCLLTADYGEFLCIEGSNKGSSRPSRQIQSTTPLMAEGLEPYKVSSFRQSWYDKVVYLEYMPIFAVSVKIGAHSGSTPVCRFVVKEGDEVDVRDKCPQTDFSRTDLAVEVTDWGTGRKLCFEGGSSSDSSCYSAAVSTSANTSTRKFSVSELGEPGKAGVIWEGKGSVRGKLQKVKY